jgi:hypothetical protein
VTVVRDQLRHVYWIGGGSGAGKSAIAGRLARRHGLKVYATDDVMRSHGSRPTPEDRPLTRAFAAMGMDERWVDRTPAAMLETFPWFAGEGFGLIVEDLLRLPREPGVLVEGFRLLPHLVQPLLAVPSHAVWLLPTPRFRRAVFTRRGPGWGFLPRVSDPDRALANLLARDGLFTDRLAAETARLGLPALSVDVTMTEDDLAARVSGALGL